MLPSKSFEMSVGVDMQAEEAVYLFEHLTGLTKALKPLSEKRDLFVGA